MKFVARAVIGGIVVATVMSGCAASPEPSPSPTPSAPASAIPAPSVTASEPTPTPTPTAEPTFDSTKYSIDEASSYWVVVNKMRPLSPKDYAPADLVTVNVPFVHPPSMRATAARAVEKLFADFHAETGLSMSAQSAYRSYTTQVGTYNGWVNKLGKKAADLTSARPGHSEHQTGLAIDISASDGSCSLNKCFATTSQGKWIAKNAYKYGFIVRYPEGKTPVTGYEFEPWHVRFVGIPLATEMRDKKIATLEEFFGLPAAPDYAG